MINPRVPNCEACPFGEHREKCVYGNGPIDSELLVLAEAPGENEMRDGIPLTGWTGIFTNETLGHFGFPRKDIRVENCFQFKAKYTSKEGKAAASACGASIWDLVRQMPRLRTAIALGEGALRELSGYRAWDEADRAFKREAKQFVSWEKKRAKALLKWTETLEKYHAKCTAVETKFREKHASWVAKPGKRKEPVLKLPKSVERPAVMGEPIRIAPVAPSQFGVKGIMNFRGSPLWVHGYGPESAHPVRLFPCIHPAACAPKRQPRLRPLIMADLRRATEFHKGSRSEQIPTVLEIRSPQALREFLPKLPRGRIGFDIEWSRKRNEFVCIGIGTDVVGVVVFVDSTGWRMPVVERGQCFALLQRVFSDSDYEFGGHHVDGYDCHKLESQGLLVTPKWCSLCAFHILHADLGSAKDEDVEIRGKKAVASALGYDLGFVGSCLTNMPFHKGVVTGTIDALDVDPKALYEYCGRDVAMSWWAQVAMDAEGSRTMPNGLFQAELDHEMELVRRASKMSRRGVPVRDDERIKRLREWQAKQEEIASTIPFNIASGPQLATYLESKSIKVRRNQETGLPMLDGNEILKLSAKHPQEPIWSAVRAYRQAEKKVVGLESLEPAFWDGHVHSSFKIHGSVGPRWSSAGPNLQNLEHDVRELLG